MSCVAKSTHLLLLHDATPALLIMVKTYSYNFNMHTYDGEIIIYMLFIIPKYKYGTRGMCGFPLKDYR